MCVRAQHEVIRYFVVSFDKVFLVCDDKIAEQGLSRRLRERKREA